MVIQFQLKINSRKTHQTLEVGAIQYDGNIA